MDQIEYKNDILHDKKKGRYPLSQDELYQLVYVDCYSAIRTFIYCRGGNQQDLKDILSDMFLITTAREEIDPIMGKDSPIAYLVAIGRNLWIKESMRRHTISLCTPEPEAYDALLEKELLFDRQQQYDLYWKHFIRMGHECKKILRAFYKRQTASEIAEMLGLSLDNYYKKKSVCIKYLENKIRQDPKFNLINKNCHGNN